MGALETVLLPNGLRKMSSGHYQCQRCHNACEAIVRPQLYPLMHLLSDCCSNPVRAIDDHR